MGPPKVTPIECELIEVREYGKEIRFGNKEYAYEATAYWDPKTRKSCQKSKYLSVIVDRRCSDISLIYPAPESFI